MFKNNSEEKNLDKFYEDLNKELDMIQTYINLQKQRTISIAESHDIIVMNTIKTHSKEWEELLNQTNDISRIVLENISDLEALQIEVNKILELVIAMQSKKSKEENFSQDFLIANEKLKMYLTNKETTLEKVLNNYGAFEKFNKSVICNIKKTIYDKSNLTLENNETQKEKTNQDKEKPTLENRNGIKDNIKTESKEINIDKLSSAEDNNILIISEKNNKVYLPYKIVDLEKELKSKKQYNTIKDLIENEYIINLDRFKNSIRARFKESYNLIKKREKGSIISATQLALELMFNYSLNPAIIAACKNEDELDIYLDCLEDNELDDFKIFDVKYEMLPSVNVIKERKSKH